MTPIFLNTKALLVNLSRHFKLPGLPEEGVYYNLKSDNIFRYTNTGWDLKAKQLPLSASQVQIEINFINDKDSSVITRKSLGGTIGYTHSHKTLGIVDIKLAVSQAMEKLLPKGVYFVAPAHEYLCAIRIEENTVVLVATIVQEFPDGVFGFSQASSLNRLTALGYEIPEIFCLPHLGINRAHCSESTTVSHTLSKEHFEYLTHLAEKNATTIAHEFSSIVTKAIELNIHY